jgi:hypothetical protein
MSEIPTPRPVSPLPLAALMRSALRAGEQIPATVAAAAPGGAGAPLQRTVLVNELVSCSAANAVGTAQLLTESPDSGTIGEILAMQAAFLGQLWTIEQAWRAGLMQIYQGSVSLRKANTLSKVVEQDFNLVGQVGDLMTNALTSTASLIESANVGYAYWLSNKLSALHSR